MTHRKEIESLAARLRERGASVTLRLDGEGFVDGVTVSGVRGIGPFEMAPISFAERAREALSR